MNVADTGLSGGYVSLPGISGYVTLVAELNPWLIIGSQVVHWVVGFDDGFGTQMTYGIPSLDDSNQISGG